MLASVWEDIHRQSVEEGAPSSLEPMSDYVTMVATRILDGEFPL